MFYCIHHHRLNIHDFGDLVTGVFFFVFCSAELNIKNHTTAGEVEGGSAEERTVEGAARRSVQNVNLLRAQRSSYNTSIGTHVVLM